MKFFKPLIIPLFLVFGYLLFISYPYFFSKINSFDSLGILSLVEEKSDPIKRQTSSDRVTDQLDNHLLKSEKIISRIKATEDNFGIVLFRFAQLSAKVEDSVTFRIKEQGSRDWYYVSNYRADQFQPDQYFTFGFPQIMHSKGKVYIFEIESMAGTYKNGIGWSNVRPQVAMVYKYKAEQMKDLRILSSFIIKKFIYVFDNLYIWQKWKILIAALFFYIVILFINKQRATRAGFLPYVEWDTCRRFFKRSAKRKQKYPLLPKTIVRFSKKVTNQLIATQFYSVFLNTNMKKRLIIGLLLFIIAFLYRFSSASVDQLGVASFYSGLGGQGDYDQFIRAATCAIKNFCPAILGQNFLIESSVLGIFYELFGFTGGLKAYLYLMIVLSSIVAILPYLLLSRKHVFTIGGIIGSLFLAASDYLIHMAINLPPDNGSLFTFSMFFIVYLLTMQHGTMRWLLFFGLMGAIDGLNKLVMLMNDVAVLLLFIPVFLYEKIKKIKKFPFVRVTPKLVFYSLLPFLVFLVIYSLWEFVVEIKFHTPYYLRALIEGGSTYSSSTDVGSVSTREILSKSILEILYYYAGLTIVMQKRIIDYAGLHTPFLAPVFIGLLFFTFRKSKFSVKKLLSVLIFLIVVFIILALFKNNYLDIQEVGMYVYAWPESYYTNVFLFTSILFLFFVNFKYSALRLVIPILPYYIMLIVLTKNAPWGRMWVHVIVWSIILFSFLIDWILINAKKDYALKKLWIGPLLLMLFIFFYIIPKTSDMLAKLHSGLNNTRNEVTYLKWVNAELPNNALILVGGKSDLVTVSENIKRPIIYNTLWTTALLIKPNEIPRVKPTDFAILDQLKITTMPGMTPNDFSIIGELKNKNNFKKNKYLILEDDIFLWRERLAGVDDSVFATASATLLHADHYVIKVYKFNSALNAGIYELKLKL